MRTGNHETSHSQSAARTTPGFILVDSTFNPIFMNPEAAAILSYSSDGKALRADEKHLVDKIKSVFAELGGDRTGCSSTKIRSGRRSYHCSRFLLKPSSHNEQLFVTAILLERNSRPFDFELSGFSFTQRERQVVQLLALGLTTKEIAKRLEISPYTVKTFLRMIMTKTEIRTRSGIVGKLLQNIQD